MYILYLHPFLFTAHQMVLLPPPPRCSQQSILTASCAGWTTPVPSRVQQGDYEQPPVEVDMVLRAGRYCTCSFAVELYLSLRSLAQCLLQRVLLFFCFCPPHQAERQSGGRAGRAEVVLHETCLLAVYHISKTSLLFRCDTCFKQMFRPFDVTGFPNRKTAPHGNGF